MKKIREVLRLRHGRGASIRETSLGCSLAVSTVSEYLYRAEAAGFKWPLPEGLDDTKLEKALFPGPVKKGEAPRPLPDFSLWRSELSRKGVTILLLWREYKAGHENGYGYSRIAGLYADWEKGTEARMLQRHKAGEKLFVDWAGPKLRITDPKTGEVWEAPVFVSAMGASQYTFCKAYRSQELRWWLSGHVDSFEFYGALPEIVVPDNLKTGVEKACRYEPTLNSSYAEMAQFYEIAVLPARVRKPRDKAKVENAVQQIERWALAPIRERTFFSLEEANEALAEKLAELNDRLMRGPNASRKELFEAEERPAMRPLPQSRYAYAEWKKAKVAPDYHVEVEGHLYSVPFTLLKKHVDVRISASVVEVFYENKRVASHLRSYRRKGFTTDPSHMPEPHKRHAEWTPERIVRWAQTVGPNTASFVEALLSNKVHPEQGFRPCMGVIGLEGRFDKARLEAACGKALSFGALSYHSVKSILEKNLEAAPRQETLPPLPNHDNVRGGSYYAQEDLCVKSH